MSAGPIEIKRLKHVATLNDDTLPENTPPDYELQYIDIGNVDALGEIQEVVTYRFEDAPSRARRRVQDGDTIISTVRTYLKAIAPIFNPPKNLVVSTGFAVVRPKPGVLHPAYAKYALRDEAFLGEVVSRSVGVSYPAINASDLGDIEIFLPPLRQQQHLAALLDRETARLDQLVAAKQTQLALIAEKRRALITRAVTQGLDAASPRRATGLPWLGEVPAEWEVVPLKHLGSIQYGVGQPPEYTSEGVPFLRATNVTKGIITEEGLVFVAADILNDTRAIQLQTGDIIVVRSGAYTGDSAMITPQWAGAVAGFDMVFRPSYRVFAPFIALALLAQYVLEAQIDPLRIRAAQPHLNAEELGSALIALPPLVEQHKIIARFSVESQLLETMRTHCQQSIDLMQERRAALIAAAVTGELLEN